MVGWVGVRVGRCRCTMVCVSSLNTVSASEVGPN